jgi:hypothetical protein
MVNVMMITNNDYQEVLVAHGVTPLFVWWGCKVAWTDDPNEKQTTGYGIPV